LKPNDQIRTVSVWVRLIPSRSGPYKKAVLVATYATKAAAKSLLRKGEVLVNLRGIYARPSREEHAR
jgi:hypothetical protein